MEETIAVHQVQGLNLAFWEILSLNIESHREPSPASLPAAGVRSDLTKPGPEPENRDLELTEPGLEPENQAPDLTKPGPEPEDRALDLTEPEPQTENRAPDLKELN